MVLKKTIRGFAFAVLMLSIVLIGMAGIPTITFNEPPTPTNGATVNVNYVNISVTLNESGRLPYQTDLTLILSMRMTQPPETGLLLQGRLP
ncbi:MAG: hypothetical protein O8C64_08305 [Candidatus Methanoperedens sp.]|nr:hypothetical protein [Candidatus Methanoperedens sp.]